MANIIDYINNYGDKTFDELEFNDIDALVFSQLAYIDYNKVVGELSSDVRVSLKEVNEQYTELHKDDNLDNEISVVLKAIQLLDQCAHTKRYSNTKLLRFVNNVDEEIDKQFSAINFYINDETAVIAYKGTDTSLTGVKESAMLGYMFPVPAQIEGLYYLQETAPRTNRRLIILGHSKGGNLATFAAVNCSNSLKKKIDAIYEFDAPGFPLEFTQRYDYIQMKEKIKSFIPTRSIFGVMLYHNNDIKIVKSLNENIKQHQVDSWVIEDKDFVLEKETDEVSKFVDVYVKKLSQDLGEESIEESFDAFFEILENLGIVNYDALKKADMSTMFKALLAIKSIKAEKREAVVSLLKNGFKDFQSLMRKERAAKKGKDKDDGEQEIEEDTDFDFDINE